MEDYIHVYLDHIGMGHAYQSRMIECEICGETEYTTIKNIIDIGKGEFGKFPVVACNQCGFLYQNPRFNKIFYEDYYNTHYRNVVCGSNTPSDKFIEDQKKRGELLHRNLYKYVKKPGALLDVGCSAGAMMLPFIKNGWDASGTDPDSGYVAFGKEILGLPVVEVGAEEMELAPSRFDLIIIMGSLEHVFDPNKVLELCRAASKEDAFLLLEGRGHPQSSAEKYFNHNHHRYFTFNSMELMMLKHGWEPVLTTDNPLCGPSRPGAIFCLGRACNKPSTDTFQALIDSGKKDRIEDLLRKFNPKKTGEVLS